MIIVEYILLTLFSITSLIFIKNSHYRWTYLFAISLFLFFFGLVLTFTAQWQRALNFANLLFIIIYYFNAVPSSKNPLLQTTFINF